jgi:hypothetical protein
LAFGLAFSWTASLLVTSSAHAGKITFPDACWKVVEQNKYLIKVVPEDNRASESVGARLWNLDKLTQDWSLGRAGDGDCTQKIFQQAVADGSEYWESVGKKRSNYSANHDYLKVVKTVLELPQGSNCGEHHAAASHAPEEAPVKAVRNAAPVIQRALNAQTSDPKAKPEAKAEVKPAQAAQLPVAAATCSADNAQRSTEEALAMFATGCGMGIIKQFAQEVWNFVSAAGHAIAHPLDTASSLAEFASELIREPQVIARQIVESYAEIWPHSQCLTSYEKSQAVCKIGTKLLFDIGLIVTGGKTIKFTADIVKLMAKKAVKTSGVALGKAGVIVPKFIKNPIKKAATSTADAVVNKSKAAASAAKTAAKFQLYRGAVYLESNKAGQVVLKVADAAGKAKAKAALIVESRAGKILVKPTMYFARMPLYFYAGNQKEVDGFRNSREKAKADAEKAEIHHKKVEQFEAKGDKFAEDVAKSFDGVSTCEEAAKAYNAVVAKYKLTKDEYATQTLDKTYEAVHQAMADQLGVVCQKK